jgi:uncharacterized protein
MPRRAVLTLRREDGRVVADSVIVADTTFRRLRGLLGRRTLMPGEGMLLRPAWSIHTAFVRFPLDAVFIDPDQVVIRIDENLRPFSTASCRGAREVVELAAGESARRGLHVGDRVAWAPRVEDAPGTALSEPLREQPLGRVLVASRDARFTKLARFLLEGRGLEVTAVIPPARLLDEIAEAEADIVVLDANDAVGQALRTAYAVRVQRPELPIVLVAEDADANGHPGVRVYHKWDETEEVVDAVVRTLDEGDAAAVTQLETRS